jgi:DNA repair protein RecO (recombination protein O)
LLQIEEEAVIISAKKFRDHSFIISCLTINHGVVSGLYSCSKKLISIPTPGTHIKLNWKARLDEHLGRITFEVKNSPLAHIYDKKIEIMMLSSITKCIAKMLPEKEPCSKLFTKTLEFICNLKTSTTHELILSYIKLELIELISAIGFGLDLNKCAVTGKRDNLSFISPRTGAAVIHEVGLPYQDRLFTYPDYLLNDFSEVSNRQLLLGLEMSFYFLKKNMTQFFNTEVPLERQKLQTMCEEMLSNP